MTTTTRGRWNRTLSNLMASFGVGILAGAVLALTLVLICGIR